MADVREEYTNALFKLAQEENLCDVILNDVKELNVIFKDNPDYVRLLSAPNIKREERINLVDEAFSGKINLYTLNFLKIMIERGYFSLVTDCFDEFVELYNKANNIEVVTAITSVEFTDSQREKLKKVLAEKLGKKIELIEKTDSSIIGGIRLEMNGKLIDSSVKARLENIRAALNSTVL